MRLTIKEIILVAALAFVSILGILQYTGKLNLRKEYEKALAVNDSTKNVMKTYIADNGALHARVQGFEVDKKVFIATHQAYVDSLTHELGIKPKHLSSITTIATTNQGKFQTGLDTNNRVIVTINGTDTVRDTIRYYTFNYDKDKWLKFKGVIDSNKIRVQYQYSDSLTITTFRRRGGFLHLGAMHTFADVKSQNPNTTYNNMKHIELTDIKKKHFSVGPYVGYGYNGDKWSPGVGVSLQYILFEF